MFDYICSGDKEKSETPVKKGRSTKDDKEKDEEKDEGEEKTEEDEAGPSPSKKPRPAPSSSDVKEIVFSFDTTGSMYPCLTQVLL
jgi:hypothetical protein